MSRMTELEPAVLPVTVLAAHLQACAEELASSGEVELGDLVVALEHLMVGQRRLAETFTGLAERARAAHDGTLAAAPSPEVTALEEILRATSTAFGASAAALAEGAPMARAIAESTGSNKRL